MRARSIAAWKGDSSRASRQLIDFCHGGRQLLLLVLYKVVDVSGVVTKQLKTLPDSQVQDFFPLVLPRVAPVAPVAMPAELHFATFVAAFTYLFS